MRRERAEHERAREERIQTIKERKAWLRPKASFYGTAGSQDELTVRVPPVEYEQNLRDMIRIIREAGARPILLKVPMNLLWPPHVRPRIANMHRGGFWRPVGVAAGYLEDPPRNKGVRPLSGHPYLSLPTRQLFYRQLSKLFVSNIQTLPIKLAADADKPNLEGVRARNNLGAWELVHDNPAAAQRWFEAAIDAYGGRL